MGLFSQSFIHGLKRQAILKSLDLLVDAMVDFKQNYARKSAQQTETKTLPPQSLNNHL